MIHLERNMRLRSKQKLQKQRHHDLVLKFVGILTGLANIPDFPPSGTVITERTHHKGAMARLQKRYPETFLNCTEADMFALRQLLRKAWGSTDAREKEWYVFLFLLFHA